MTTTTRIDLPGEVISLDELRALGLTRAAIRHRIHTGRLHRLYPSVFAIGRSRVSPEGLWRAAVLACGAGAALSHLSAARLLRLVEQAPAWPHVTVPGTRGGSGPPGLVLHRSRTLRPEDITIHRAIPVTTVQRTLIDVVLTLPRHPLKGAVRQAVRLHRVDLARLGDTIADPRTEPRRARLRRVIRVYVPGIELTEQELEARFFELCARARVRLPEPQVWFGRHRADFTWRAERLVVEVDGRRTHDNDVAFVDDRVKDRALKTAGQEVQRFTWGEVVHESTMVGRDLRAALKRRQRELGLAR